jgi:hypothetical protein
MSRLQPMARRAGNVANWMAFSIVDVLEHYLAFA